jgi:hypothetical protein
MKALKDKTIGAVFVPQVGRFFSLWLDEEDCGTGVGTGRRCFFVYEVGRKWISLFYPPLACKVRLPIKNWPSTRPIGAEYQRRAMVARIKDNTRFFHSGDDGKVHAPAYVKTVMRLIREKRV